MKNNLILLFSVCVLAISCEENQIGIDNDVIVVQKDPTALDKKGSCYSYNAERWSHKTSDSKTHWFYHWGNTPREEIPDNVEYVPMFWGKSSVNAEVIANIQQLIDEGRVKYVLGFNEPPDFFL